VASEDKQDVDFDKLSYDMFVVQWQNEADIHSNSQWHSSTLQRGK